MNEILSDLILEDCSDERLLQVRSLLISYSALIALLHSLVGLEVGNKTIFISFHSFFSSFIIILSTSNNHLLILFFSFD
jgi:hypothetical protein